MPKKKTKAEQVAGLSWEELNRMKATKADLKILANYVNILRQGYKRRVAMFKKKGVFSYAAESAKKLKIRDTSASRIIADAMKNKNFSEKENLATARNRLLHEFAKYQQFFESDTSTLEGIEIVNAEQDERIFRKNQNKKAMNDDERKEFWSAYDEFNVQVKNKTAYMTSETVQQYLADVMFTLDNEDVEVPEDNEDAEVSEDNIKFTLDNSGEYTKYLDEYGIEAKYVWYEKGTVLRSIYEAEYRMRRAEMESQLGRVRDIDNGSIVRRGGRNT